MISLENIGVFLGFFFGMEAVAWTAHKYLMHGPLWMLHADHHIKGEEGFFERNDSFFLIFATPGIGLLYAGMTQGFDLWYFWGGLGITVYGFCYFVIHDIFIHQRFKWLRNANTVYFRAIRRAHKIHHKRLTKEDGECFGMLWVPIKYFREAARSLQNEPVIIRDTLSNK